MTSSAHLEAQQLLLALRRGADQHQHAFGLRLHARLQVDAVRPNVNILPSGQISPLPTRVVSFPLAPQTRDHRRRQVRGLLAQQRPKRLLEVAHRNPAQVEDRQQGIEAPCPPGPARQDGRREADALASIAGTPISQLWALNLDWTNPGLNLALRTVPVSHDALTPVRQTLALHRCQERFSFRLNGLGKQATGAASQDRRERIVDLIRLTEGDNSVNAHLGVSLLREVQAGFHPPRYAAFLTQPSPILRHSPIRIARCTFPPGAVHVRHSHPGYLSYVLGGGKGQIQDEKGTRQVEVRTDTYTNSSPITWHELTNTGDTTLRYLVVERKYEAVPDAEQTARK